MPTRKLKVGWTIETTEDLREMHGMNKHPSESIQSVPRECVPSWVDKYKAIIAIMDTHKMIKMCLPEDMEIDNVAALADNGRIVPAYSPDNEDVWFLFSYSGKSYVFIYNGEQAIPCKLIASKEKEGLEEVWIDTSRTISLYSDIQEALDKMISEYVS